MKRYRICFLLFVITSVVCMTAGFGVARYRSRVLRAEAQKEIQKEIPKEIQPPVSAEAETREVVSQQKVEHKTGTLAQMEEQGNAAKPETDDREVFYLVSEDGFLLVFAKDKKTICLYTHIPITDFPAREQGRLREGIWFSDMMEVFHYLESYTS